jgi:hypothetical protein
MASLIDESSLPLASLARRISLQKQHAGRMSRMVEDMFSLTRADVYQLQP